MLLMVMYRKVLLDIGGIITVISVDVFNRHGLIFI